MASRQIQERHNMPALLQVVDPSTKQDTATFTGADFNMFYTVVVNLTNNASIGSRPAVKPNVNVVNDKDGFHVDREEVHDSQGCWISGLDHSQDVMCMMDSIIVRENGRKGVAGYTRWR